MDAVELDALSIVAAIATTLALAVFAIGTTLRVAVWVRTPSPLPIPLAPAPRSRSGIALRLVAELFAFRSLARASLATWLPALLFHYALLLLLIVHLRFLHPMLPLWLLPFLRASGWATLVLIVGLGALLWRRAFVDRVRRVSAPSDYLHVVLLLSIALSGAALKRLWPVDLHAVGEFLRGVLTLGWQPLPGHAGLVLHLASVLLLLLVFPISKLVHAPGIAFAPTFHQRDPHGRGGRGSDARRGVSHPARAGTGSPSADTSSSEAPGGGGAPSVERSGGETSGDESPGGAPSGELSVVRGASSGDAL